MGGFGGLEKKNKKNKKNKKKTKTIFFMLSFLCKNLIYYID